MPEINVNEAKHGGPPGRGGRLIISPELIEEFLVYLGKKGRTQETVSAYRNYLNRIYSYVNYMTTDCEIQQGTLDGFWRQMEVEGFSANSINVSISAVNSLFEYCGRRDLQIPKRAKERLEQPTLTRAEYQRLLQAAKRQGKEQTYLLVKMFGCTGIGLSELKDVTAEAVRIGTIASGSTKEERVEIHLPRFLSEELENYAERQDILYGPIFVNRSGKPLSRSTVAQLIADLAQDAHVAREKCNPRCLQKLCYETRQLIEKNMFAQMQQIYESMLEQEQLSIGWTPTKRK